MNEFRIFGPPGTGKTTATGELVAQNCQKYGSEAILVASFTRTAARELVQRNLPINTDQIGTLHAHAYRALDRPKLVNKALLKEWNEEHPLRAFGGIGSDLDDPYGSFESSGKMDGDVLLEQLNRLRGLQVEEESWPLTVQAFAEDWAHFKDNTFSVDFTDLIDRCLKEHVPIPHDAAVMFLDEVQDFSPLELALARSWGQDCESIYLAGDDDQCLYSFKGATPDAFLYPALPAEQLRILGQSYRVPRAVHAAATAWVEQISVRQPKEYHPRPVDGLVDTLDITYSYPGPLQDDLEQWLKDGKTVAILASCSFFLDPVKRLLREWGVPFHNPYRLTRGDWNPLGHRSSRDEGKNICLASDRLMAYLKPSLDPPVWWSYADLWNWAGVLEADGLFVHGAKTEIRRKAEDEKTAKLSVDASDLERWISDPDAADHVTAGNIPWYRSKILSSYDKPMDYACNIYEARGLDALVKKPQVILGTIHSVKGGEADIVVLFPDLSPAGYMEWTSPGEGEDSVRRCFYVGMTRAKEALYWAQPAGKSIEGYL